MKELESEAQYKAMVSSIQNAGTDVVNAKQGAGSATLSMAYAAFHFATSCMKAMNGFPGIVECAYVDDDTIEGMDFFGQKVKLGKNGICRKLGCGKMDSHETLGLEEMKQQLIEEQAKGKLWAKQEGHQHASLHLRPGRNSEGAIAEFLTGQALSREHYTRASHCASHADGFNVGSWCTTERAG
eukprot:TRINITY_DN5593_c0_g1_i5.p1 TRINITY_DN5593_c0_g1~~TRINITY_DN5593_c0_g1_i5.p1  ORF type:complete len:184 (-),score=23.89 TRINITY_DN5593_c0_g1_i5:202-753(-)